MPVALLRKESGFTYIAALMIVVVIGIMLGATGQTWTIAMKREREAELLFRGTQIRDAISRWWTRRPGQPPPQPIKELKDLVKSPESLATVRFLRRIYKDPMTGKDFELLRDPVKGVIGVRSTSNDKPMKEKNFPVDQKHFEGKQKYSDWVFVDTKIFPNFKTPPTLLPGGAPSVIPGSKP